MSFFLIKIVSCINIKDLTSLNLTLPLTYLNLIFDFHFRRTSFEIAGLTAGDLDLDLMDGFDFEASDAIFNDAKDNEEEKIEGK